MTGDDNLDSPTPVCVDRDQLTLDLLVTTAVVREHRPTGAGGIVNVVVGAAVAGVIGNVAYDILKAEVKRLRLQAETKGIGHVRRGARSIDWEGEQLARLAVRVRCSETDLFPIPEINDTCKIHYEQDDAGFVYNMQYREFTARVLIPSGHL